MATLLFHAALCWRSRLAGSAVSATARSIRSSGTFVPEVEVAEVKVGDASLAEADAIARVVNWAYRGKYQQNDRNAWTGERHLLSGIRTTPDAVREQITRGRPDQSEALLLARTDVDTVVGTVSVKAVRPGVAEIGMLSVDPDLQSQGVGSVLLSAAERRAEAFGAETFEMFVIDCRAELLRWYSRKGYTPCTDDRRVPFPVDAGVGTPRADVGTLQFIRVVKDVTLYTRSELDAFWGLGGGRSPRRAG